jgi:hypothetical protein
LRHSSVGGARVEAWSVAWLVGPLEIRVIIESIMGHDRWSDARIILRLI